MYLHIVGYKRPSCASPRPLEYFLLGHLFPSVNVRHGGNRVVPLSLLWNAGKCHDPFRRYKEEDNIV